MNKLFTLLACLLLSAATFAQHKVVADKIVGIVGDKIVLRSDVFNEIQDRQRRNEPIPENAACAIFDQILIIKALTLQAEKDSIPFSDEELEAILDNKVRYYAQNYGGKEALEQIAGKTIYQLKEDLRLTEREMQLSKLMRNKVVENVKITPQEVKAYWEKIPKDSLPFYESEVEVGQIIVYPKASRDFEKLAIDELTDYKRQVEEKKAKIETLASLYSEDPGVKQNNGEYTINRTEKQWDPAFIQHAFRLQDGQVSPVFKSRFGYHIIQMVTRSGDDAVVRHILRIPRVTATETNQAINKLDTVRAQLIAGTLGFGEAASKYGEDENLKYSGGLLQAQNEMGVSSTYLTVAQLDKDLVLMLGNMKVGEYSKPVVFTDENRKTAVRVVFLKSRSEPHRENLKDDYNRISQRALELKKQEVLEKWFATKLPNYYIMLDEEFRNCSNMAHWWQYAAKGGTQ